MILQFLLPILDTLPLAESVVCSTNLSLIFNDILFVFFVDSLLMFQTLVRQHLKFPNGKLKYPFVDHNREPITTEFS